MNFTRAPNQPRLQRSLSDPQQAIVNKRNNLFYPYVKPSNISQKKASQRVGRFTINTVPNAPIEKIGRFTIRTIPQKNAPKTQKIGRFTIESKGGRRSRKTKKSRR